MAVRHGYGKIAGTDALVFAYDTGDTRNSYRGEPTTNLQAAGGAFGHNSGTYGNVVTVTDATSEKGPGWKKVTISNRGSNFRIIQFTYTSMSANIMYCHSAVFDWGNMRDKGYYINHDGSGTGTRAFYKPGDYTTNQGSSISINSSLADGKIAGTIIHTASHSHAFFINNNTTGVSGLNDYFYYREYQVEANTHPTQYTSGTRSATQGLLDLTGRSTIDLSNVSFDSNAQMTFDGTSDVFYTGNLPQLDTFTLEVVLKPTTLGGWFLYRNTNMNYTDNADNFIFGFNGSSLYGGVEYSPTGADKSVTSTTVLTTGQYVHGVLVHDNTTLTLRIYINGTLEGTTVSTGENYPYRSTNKASIGADGGSNHGGISGNKYFYNGEIPVTKIYNRVLTADEIRNNYRHYKTRFNI
jgi:hypothetical protein